MEVVAHRLIRAYAYPLGDVGSMPLIHVAAARPANIQLALGRPSPVPHGRAANQALRSAATTPPLMNASHDPSSSASGGRSPRAAWRTSRSPYHPKSWSGPRAWRRTHRPRPKRDQSCARAPGRKRLHPLAEIDWLGDHHHSNHSGRVDHRIAFSAWTMAAIIVASALRPARAVTPSTANSVPPRSGLALHRSALRSWSTAAVGVVSSTTAGTNCNSSAFVYASGQHPR